MTKKRTSLDSILPTTTSPTSTATKKRASASTRDEVKPKRRPNLKQPALYLKIPVHRQLRILAFEEEKKMHDLFLEAIDLLFAERGLPSISEIELSNDE